MPKKKITGASKLLTEKEPSAPPTAPLNLTTPKVKKPRLKNFRLNDVDQEQLRRIVDEVNRLSPYKKISEATIIKSLIFLGSKMPPEKILKATKEV